MSKPKHIQDDIIIYRNHKGEPIVSVSFSDKTVWLNQAQLAKLFDTTKQNVSLHIKTIYKDGELDKNSTVKKFLTVQKEGKREISRMIDYYNLDMIISLGYRIQSKIATDFRKWATKRLQEYVVKGFTIDDQRLKDSGGGDYWKELLDRIRDIRSSEKALYRQVLDLYATSIDYNKNSQESIVFFKTVQNKLHYATNMKTAAETIYQRADSEKDFMGLTTFAGAMPNKKEVIIAKNYLTEKELFRLRRMVSAFFDLAEIKAEQHQSMRMKDWIEELDKFTINYGKGALKGSGKISHKQAKQKAESEYKKFQAKNLSEVEKDYLESIKLLEKNVKEKHE